ncbi:amino acid permease [Rothia nasimurium]|uniref:amino acid permease n=1 Tax=Rothia nasimurium TaxID=85336 RepID=UPI001F21FFB4|nr:amino acid permease [Rothia nasimurium]
MSVNRLHASGSEPSLDSFEGSASPRLARTLQPRHLSMIAMGGAIGAGLLVASSTAIATAGPAVILTYLLAGTVLVLVMRMLGEMAASTPETGSFSVYARRYIGRWAGFSVGWLYWWFWSVTVAIEATAAAAIISDWVPSWPQWLVALVMVVAFLGLNLLSVRSYGEAEFWFSSIKIGAIVVIIAVGVLALLGLIPNSTASLAHYTAGGGFFANGVGAVFTALLAVIFSMFGAEIATVAAGESSNPALAVTKAVRSVIFRVLFFYVGSIAVTLAVIPWTSVTSGVSPFVTMFEVLGIPYAGLAMNIVVLTALLSCLNASLYAASRMVFALAEQGDAPACFSRVSSTKAPRNAIILSTLIGFASVLLNYFMPEQVFALLVNSTGGVGIFVWLIVAVSHLRFRRVGAGLEPGLEPGAGVLAGPDGRPAPASLRLAGWPWVNYLLIAGLTALLVYMGVTEKHRVEVLISCAVALALSLAGAFLHRSR